MCTQLITNTHTHTHMYMHVTYTHTTKQLEQTHAAKGFPVKNTFRK